MTQSARIDALANAGQDFALYGSQMAVIRAALAERRDQAGAAAEAEISGRGPTGVPGAGPVSNAFRAAESKYAEAADLLDAALSKGEDHVARLGETITAMRTVQVDPDLSRAERSAKLKALTGTAIGEMRALLALDPARSITAAAGIVATGVPEPSRAPASSRARIAEIRGGMTAYAASLQAEAERIAALAPEIPEQTTLSPAERLIANMWRMPGLTMAALLLDLAAWITFGFRMAIYTALRAKMEEEKGEAGPQYILVDDLRRLKGILQAADETRREIEDLRPVARRGRPPLSATKKRARDLSADQEGGQ
ncbi:MAG: hypothetical protein AAF675_21425 [Pseudomonadota bacterium]